jgi:Ca2+-binding RTX toxin-like protein
VTSRSVVAAVLVVPSLVLLGGPWPASYAAATCQGQAATIESTSGTVTGTEGNDVIVATNPHAVVSALGGNDLVCVVGGKVSAGDGDDSILSAATGKDFTEVSLHGGNDSYTNVRAGDSRVYISEVTRVKVNLGLGAADVWLLATSTPGTGSIHFGSDLGRLFAMGESEAHVDLKRRTAGVDNLLNVKITDVFDATATGRRVRMTGNDFKNDLAAAGCDVVIRGDEGRDILHKVGGGTERSASTCPKSRFRSVLMGGLGPDRLFGRGDDDVLVGGPGRDVVYGKGGRDRCVAEVEHDCER